MSPKSACSYEGDWKTGARGFQCLEVHLSPESQSRTRFYNGRLGFLPHSKMLV